MAKKKKGRPRSGGSSGTGRGRYNKRRRSSLGPARRSGPPEGDTADNGEPLPLVGGYGLLELHPNGYGFLRSPVNNYPRERTVARV